MKVLFAVSNETISDSIDKKYQKDYKEIISYKMYITLMQYKKKYKEIKLMIELS